MRVFAVVTFLSITLVSAALDGQQDQRTTLARAVAANPNNVPALTAYAEYLERYGDPGARDAYAKLLAALRNSSDGARAGVIAGRLAALDILAGDREAAGRDLETYRSATGKNVSLGR